MTETEREQYEHKRELGRAASQRYRERNRERVREQNRAQKARAKLKPKDPAKAEKLKQYMREYMRTWRDVDTNREAARERERRWRESNPERVREKQRAWRAANGQRNRDNAYRNNLKRFGLTPDAYDALMTSQNGACAICGSKTSGRKRDTRLLIDHCHETGVVRGLLCHPCNAMLGNARDSAARLRAAAAYLERLPMMAARDRDAACQASRSRP